MLRTKSENGVSINAVPKTQQSTFLKLYDNFYAFVDQNLSTLSDSRVNLLAVKLQWNDDKEILEHVKSAAIILQQ